MSATPNTGRRRPGFTLIELLVALGLFALISVAGFSLLSGVIGTRDRLDGRLQRVAELQRAMYLISLDAEAMTTAPLQADGGSLAFSRSARDVSGGEIAVRYFMTEGALHRQAGSVDQSVIEGVSSLEWRFLQDGAWVDHLPAAPPGVVGPPSQRPRAVEMTLALAPGQGALSGRLRRVVDLPREPR